MQSWNQSSHRYKKVIIFENKMNFVMAPYEEGTLYLFVGGYPGPKVCRILHKLNKISKKETAPYRCISQWGSGLWRNPHFSIRKKSGFPGFETITDGCRYLFTASAVFVSDSGRDKKKN